MSSSRQFLREKDITFPNIADTTRRRPGGIQGKYQNARGQSAVPAQLHHRRIGNGGRRMVRLSQGRRPRGEDASEARRYQVELPRDARSRAPRAGEKEIALAIAIVIAIRSARLVRWWWMMMRWSFFSSRSVSALHSHSSRAVGRRPSVQGSHCNQRDLTTITPERTRGGSSLRSTMRPMRRSISLSGGSNPSMEPPEGWRLSGRPRQRRQSLRARFSGIAGSARDPAPGCLLVGTSGTAPMRFRLVVSLRRCRSRRVRALRFERSL